MPNARVGAMPQPPSQSDVIYHEDHRRGRGVGVVQQGITMQDLKKQTAMRLAQEQHQLRSGSGSRQQQQQHPQQQSHNNRSQRHNTPPQAQAPPSLAPYQTQPRNSNRYSGNNQYVQHPSSRAYQEQRLNYHPNNDYNSHPQRRRFQDPSLHHPPKNNAQLPSGYYTQQPDLLSETSSVRSDHDCNTETSSVVSGTSSVHYHSSHPHRNNISSVSSLQAAAGIIGAPPSRKTKPPQRQDLHTHHRQVQHSLDSSSSVVSNSSSRGHSNRGGRSPSAVAPPSTTPPIKHCNSHPSQKQGAKQQAPMVQTNLNCPVQEPHPLPPPMMRQCQEEQYLHPHQHVQHVSILPASSYPHDHQRLNKHNSSNRAFYQQQQQLKNQPKLPHGLTVHELKEMTRARLAREAASENNKDQFSATAMQKHGIMSTSRPTNTSVEGAIPSNNEVPTPFRPQPHQFNRNPIQSSVSQQSMSSTESWSRAGQQDHLGNRIHQPHHASQPIAQQNQQMNSSYLNSTKLSQLLQSQPGLQNQVPHAHFHDQNKYHLDSVDSGSVTSFNSTIGSDYLGSESASVSFLGPSPHQPPNDDDMLFVRSFSYPSGHNSGEAYEKSDTPRSSSSYFETSGGGLGSVGGSRRRLGSSPPGFHLEVAHEDRPLSVEEELGLPIYNERRLEVTHSLDNLSYQTRETTGSHQKDRNMNSNKEVEYNSLSPPTLGDHTRATSMNGELPNWVAESVLGTPMLNEGRKAVGRPNVKNDRAKGNGADAVFRTYNTHLDFANENEVKSVSSNGLFYPDVCISGRSDGGSGSWGGSTSVMSGPSMNEFLNHDFCNLLSLNSKDQGFELRNRYDDKRDLNSSNFVSRIDPEVLGPPTSIDHVAHADIAHNVNLSPGKCNTIAELYADSMLAPVTVSSRSQHSHDHSSTRKRRDKTRRRKDYVNTSN